MPRKQVWTVVVLAAVLAWSTEMTVSGQLAAVSALLPSLGLLVQQLAAVFAGKKPRPHNAMDTGPAVAVGEGPLR